MNRAHAIHADFNTARGIMTGVLLGTQMWIAIALLIYWLVK